MNKEKTKTTEGQLSKLKENHKSFIPSFSLQKTPCAQILIQPLVSVVVPTYKRPDLLLRTLHSILAQNYMNLEIIVISDGVSRDNENVVRQLNDSRLKYLDQENSGGAASPRNHGMKVAQGKYIAFCDDDDLWLSDKLEKQISFMKENPDIALCYCNMSRFDKKKEWVYPHEGGYADFNTLLRFNNVPISSVVIRRDILDKVGYFNEDKKIGAAEDYEYILRIAWNNKISFIDEILIKYWSEVHRMTRISSKDTFQEAIKYFLDSFYCYISVKKFHNIQWYVFFIPFIRNFYIFLKRVYVFCRDTKF